MLIIIIRLIWLIYKNINNNHNELLLLSLLLWFFVVAVFVMTRRQSNKIQRQHTFAKREKWPNTTNSWALIIFIVMCLRTSYLSLQTRNVAVDFASYTICIYENRLCVHCFSSGSCLFVSVHFCQATHGPKWEIFSLMEELRFVSVYI